ncbi:sensor histidine kinase [Neptunomonas japonica]|uniref:histidine kinase n=1 Tax=Neptunomonas japonica JAMM 1380 TaxID=1441457 RepID=A0A7R6SX27_9GAMM|nr:ATP-binding protein [Neptunomonas japonica]BBB30405.1 two-component system sensor histidine kinase [Neptunomonas japonica JAMM 1380]
MSDDVNPYQQAHAREKAARLKAELLLEDKSRKLYIQKQKLEESYVKLRQQESAMLQNEKLATLGTLSAGVAHEINNPLAFVLSNMESLNNYALSFQKLLLLNQNLLQTDLVSAEARSSLTTLIDEEDLTFVNEDMSELLKDTGDGLCRVRDIVNNLRSFSRTQNTDQVETDLLEGLKGTLKLLDSELKGNVNLQLSLQELPKTICNPNEINQVLLNLIINAKQATEHAKEATLKISSRCKNDIIRIRIQDNGCGMSDEVKKQIFVPFFTTKPVGQGTGMGMAVAYGIIADHQGKIVVQSKEGIGTVFEVQLPVVAKTLT